MSSLVVLVRVLPLFAGLLIVPWPGNAYDLFYFLKRGLVFFLLFLSWGAFRAVTVKLTGIRTSGSKNTGAPTSERPYYFAILIAGVFSLLTLQQFRTEQPTEAFYLALAVMCLGAVVDVLRRKRRPGLMLLPALLQDCGAGYLSYFVLAGAWNWQALLFSSSIMFGVLAVRMVSVLEADVFPLRKGVLSARENGVSAPISPAAALLSRIYPICLSAGPTIVGCMVYAHQLALKYLMVLVVIPLCAPLIREARGMTATGLMPLNMARRSAFACWLFVAMLLLIRIL